MTVEERAVVEVGFNILFKLRLIPADGRVRVVDDDDDVVDEYAFCVASWADPEVGLMAGLVTFSFGS